MRQLVAALLFLAGVVLCSAESPPPIVEDRAPYAYDVFFGFDSRIIDSHWLSVIEVHRRALIEHPKDRIHITGFTCDIGSREYNEALAVRRAKAVRRVLIESGIDPARISLVGGGTYPGNVKTRAEMRRATIQIETVN